MLANTEILAQNKQQGSVKIYTNGVNFNTTVFAVYQMVRVISISLGFLGLSQTAEGTLLRIPALQTLFLLGRAHANKY